MADGVWAVQWSAASEWVLISGGCDGAIRFWDIRHAGCFQVLDQNRSQIGRRPSVTKSFLQRRELVLILNSQQTCYSLEHTEFCHQVSQQNPNVIQRNCGSNIPICE